MDRNRAGEVLRAVDEAVNATVGHAHVVALGMEEAVDERSRRYAEEFLRGMHRDRAADPDLITACEAMIGTLGVRGVTVAEYASAMVQWYVDRIKEERHG